MSRDLHSRDASHHLREKTITFGDLPALGAELSQSKNSKHRRIGKAMLALYRRAVQEEKETERLSAQLEKRRLACVAEAERLKALPQHAKLKVYVSTDSGGREGYYLVAARTAKEAEQMKSLIGERYKVTTHPDHVIAALQHPFRVLTRDPRSGDRDWHIDSSASRLSTSGISSSSHPIPSSIIRVGKAPSSPKGRRTSSANGGTPSRKATRR